MSHWYNMLVGASLASLLAVMLALLAGSAWRQLTRQFSRVGLVVFLIGSAIATVQAQKVIRVDANPDAPADFRTIQDAIDAVNGSAPWDTEIIVAPGVYPPVKVPEIEFVGFGVLAPFFDVTAEGGPGSVVIDGRGGEYAVAYDDPSAIYPRRWHGFVLSNAVCGAVGGFFGRSVATACKIGFKQSQLEQCIAWGNTCVGALDCSVKQSLITDNHGRSDVDASYDSTGAERCELIRSIVWGNTKDGRLANHANSTSGSDHYKWFSGHNCTDPQLNGPGDICADPLFVNAQVHDYRLKMGSPCINSVELNYLEEYEWNFDFMEDIDGNPRVQRDFVDVGPYEFQPTNESQTISAPVPVEFSWVDEKCPDLLASVGGDYDKAVLLTSANPIDIALPEPLRSYYSIWESYVADLDPTDSYATFRATITITNGVPCVKGDPESPNRKYTILGKQALTDEVWSASCPAPHFFKVRVDLK